MNDIKKLNHASIAIPTYNSSKYVKYLKMHVNTSNTRKYVKIRGSP